MEIVALICAIVAGLVFAAAALGVPRTWATVAHGAAWLTVALIIWHTVGALEPVFNK